MTVKEVQFTRLSSWLNRLGLQRIAPDILEAMGPLAYIAAQAAYLLQPLFGTQEDPVGKLARLLEDPDQFAGLVERLREEDA